MAGLSIPPEIMDQEDHGQPVKTHLNESQPAVGLDRRVDFPEMAFDQVKNDVVKKMPTPMTISGIFGTSRPENQGDEPGR